jgi:RNA recognition motif-containing protein
MDSLNNSLFFDRNLQINYSKLDQPRPPRQFSAVQPPANPPAFQRVPYSRRSIHVANLPFQITEEVLQNEYAQYGVVNLNIIRKRNCFAIIEFELEENVQRAIEEKNGSVIDGRITVVSKQMEAPAPRVNYYRGRGDQRARGFSSMYFRGFRNDRDKFSPHNYGNFNQPNQSNQIKQSYFDPSLVNFLNHGYNNPVGNIINSNNNIDVDNLDKNEQRLNNNNNNSRGWNMRGGRGNFPRGRGSHIPRGYFHSNHRGGRGSFRGGRHPRDESGVVFSDGSNHQ